MELTKEEVDDTTKRWKACPVVQWNTSCGNERICMDPSNPKCPKNSGKTEIIFLEVDGEQANNI